MMSIYSHRLELIKKLLSLNYRVSIVAPRGGEEKKLEEMGVGFIDTPVDTRGTDLRKDFCLLVGLIRIFRRERPDVVLTFYTKTNIYGGLACRMTGTPYIENITGLGSAVSGGGLMAKAMVALYRQAVKSASMVFFQNRSNYMFFREKGIAMKRSGLLPGSGVSLERFRPMEYPDSSLLEFLFISRVIKEKGIEEYVAAAREIKKKYPDTVFHVIGPCDNGYADWLSAAEREGIIEYHGKQFDVRPFIRRSHCTVFPSYYAEGMANVLLESAACARPVITTALPGCGETVDDGVTGYTVKERDYRDLVDKIERFILLSHEEKRKMGLMGRAKMEREFDREIVTRHYVESIQAILA